MKVSELIEVLKKMDQGADVYHLWSGELRSTIEHVYMGKFGACVTADENEVAYSDNARPVDAPPKSQDEYWSTPVIT